MALPALLTPPLVSAATAWRLAGIVLIAALPLLPPLIGAEPGHSVLFWLRYVVVMLALLGVYALHAWLRLPQLLLQRRVAAYTIRVIGLAAGALLLADVVMFSGPRPGHPPHRPPPPDQRGRPPRPPGGGPPASNEIGFNVIVLLAIGVLTGLRTQAAYTYRNQEEEKRRRELEQEKTQVELSYLKSQLNPHFFFNTLNNIYSLTEVDVEKARMAIYRLSRMMRYVLYQAQEATVLLSQEVQFLQDYVELMQLRLTPNMHLDIRVPAQLDDRPLAPLLLLPFLENAFKYGVSTTQPATIALYLEQAVASGTLTLRVRNHIFAPHRTGLATGSGIGLANTRRRLALLYPDRHELRIDQDSAGQTFEVSLTLWLDSTGSRTA